MNFFSIETADTGGVDDCFHAFDGEKFVAVAPYDDEACYRFPFPRTVRAISFEDNFTDPYLLWHVAGERALSDDVLETLAENWKAAHGGFNEAEKFEDFLTWLARSARLQTNNCQRQDFRFLRKIFGLAGDIGE